ncbi:hypothetical protein [Aestuariibaculum sediminum]|uniref:Uncharacterized protein n=1 Tax=Aestuariibaculum sediminum TaxID=2770637 RepID=A0A8J6U812_9FLAO|nr:hypothetical protein [Aestuariibaculum sediminum]MBD0832738.1 hypothetical protein [Aestuariibaculum sediminum]
MRLAFVTNFPLLDSENGDYVFNLIKNLRQSEHVAQITLITNKSYGKFDFCFEEKGCKVIIKESWVRGKFNSNSICNYLEYLNPSIILYNLKKLDVDELTSKRKIEMISTSTYKVEKFDEFPIWLEIRDQQEFFKVKDLFGDVYKKNNISVA